MTKKYILALDQSTKVTGYALFENEILIEHGTVVPKGDYLQRIVELRKWFIEMIDKYSPEIHVAIEDIQLQDLEGDRSLGIVTYKKLAHTQGVLLEVLTSLNIPYDTVYASSWKSTCGVQGRARAAQKASAAKFVESKYGVMPTQDECDAICIGIHLIHTKNSQFDWSD